MARRRAALLAAFLFALAVGADGVPTAQEQETAPDNTPPAAEAPAQEKPAPRRPKAVKKPKPPPAAPASNAQKAPPASNPQTAPQGQQPQAAPAAAAPNAQGQRPPAAPAGQPQAPSSYGLAILIQNALTALSQANITGNYSVLHDLGSPDFQKTNPPERLAQIFAHLRETKLNMTPLVLYPPHLARPAMVESGVLHVAGFYDTRPLRITFELAYQDVQSVWRLNGVSVSTEPAPPQ